MPQLPYMLVNAILKRSASGRNPHRELTPRRKKNSNSAAMLVTAAVRAIFEDTFQRRGGETAKAKRYDA